MRFRRVAPLEFRAALRLPAEYTDHVRALADACQRCQAIADTSGRDHFEIAEQVAAEFGLKPDAVADAWIHKTRAAVNALVRYRKSLHESE